MIYKPCCTTISKMHPDSCLNCTHNLHLLLIFWRSFFLFCFSFFLLRLCSFFMVFKLSNAFSYSNQNILLIAFMFIWLYASSSPPFVITCLSAFLPCGWLISFCVYCSRNATYESLLGTRQPFPKSVPLSVSVSWIFIVPCWDNWSENAELLIVNLVFKNRKWLNSWWMFGRVKECMVETWEV
jgi:hypothetical protein